MATIARNTKAGGSTDVQAGQTIVASDLNTDMNTIYNEFNGSISNANISGSAAIAYSKLNLAASIVSADLVDGTIVNADVNASAAIAATKLDDISATDDAHDDTTTPGVSNSHTLPTTISGELQQLRYVAERQALGIAAARFDATGTIEATFWGDIPVRNLQRIPGINGVTVSGLPSGWSNVATATLAQEAADAADATAGKGRAIKITAAGSANEGISFTLSGVKASTKYFVAALMKATAGDTAKLDTTGADATSDFRNITVTTTATAWTWLYGVVQTDATPTNLVIRCLAAADTDIVWVADALWGECIANPVATSPRVAVIEHGIASTAGTTITGSTTDAGLPANYQFIDDGSTDLDYTVYVPGDGYFIEVEAKYWARDASIGDTGTTFTARLIESAAGGALTTRDQSYHDGTHDGADNVQEVYSGTLMWTVKSPTPGASYRYALIATKGGANPTNITPQLGNNGFSALKIKVLPYGG